MEDWIGMFCGSYLRDLNANAAKQKIQELVEYLRPKLYHEGVWTLDYRRLRVFAVKTPLAGENSPKPLASRAR